MFKICNYPFPFSLSLSQKREIDSKKVVTLLFINLIFYFSPGSKTKLDPKADTNMRIQQVKIKFPIDYRSYPDVKVSFS